MNQIKKNLEIVVPENGIEAKLKWSKEHNTPLRIKLGFDPTAPDLHLGHAVALKKMREFQKGGHKIVIIIGDFTASIGDPTGRNKTRPPLSTEEIQANAKTYLDQLEKIIDLSLAEVHFNSKWFNQMHFKDVIGLVSQVTVSQILQREDFHNRYKNNIPIHLHELLYPIVQGYDSFMIEADVEMGGTDQLFNCLVGRDIQAIYNKRQQVVACVPILRGTDGQQKMSKSLNNYIGLTEDPNNMYGKVMSIPDSLIPEYARLVSTFSDEKIEEICKEIEIGTGNPMSRKKELAFDIVSQFHGSELAEKGAEYFYKQVQSRDEDLIEYTKVSLASLQLPASKTTLLALCSTLHPEKSKSELRRLIEGGGVTLHSEKVLDPNYSIEKCGGESFKLKIGKRNFYEISLS